MKQCPPLRCACAVQPDHLRMGSAARSFAQWNLILGHLQHSKTLWKHKNKWKLFELNMHFVRILIKISTYYIIHKVCTALRTLRTQLWNIHAHWIKNLLSVRFSLREHQQVSFRIISGARRWFVCECRQLFGNKEVKLEEADMKKYLKSISAVNSWRLRHKHPQQRRPRFLKLGPVCPTWQM